MLMVRVVVFAGLVPLHAIDRIVKNTGAPRSPSRRSWCIEFGSTLSVVIATIQEQPVSTTHCQIGAVTAVALASLGCKHVQWSMLGKILVSWILTIPTSAVIAAIILWIFRPAVCASCPWS